MSQRVTAIYENGVLRPLAPLDLPEHARVELNVEAAPGMSTASALTANAPTAGAQAVRDALRRAGASVSPLSLQNAAPRRLSSENQDALAARFADERPLGDLIGEDRDGREF